MKLTIKTQSGQKVVDLNSDLQFNTIKGEQYVFSNGFSNYVLNFKDNQESVTLTFNVDGKSIKVELNGIVPLLQANTVNMPNPTAIIINKDLNEKDVDNIVENSNFDGGEIIDRLEALLSKPVELGDNANSNLTLITDYQTLLESLGAAAAGEAGGNATGNGSTFNSIFSINDRGLNDIADTARWENLTESISTIPVETADTVAPTAPVAAPTATLTLNDVSVNEGTGTATVGGSLDYAPQTTLVVTLSNGSTITFGPDYVVGTIVQSTPFEIQGDDVYKDGESYTISVTGTTGGNFENIIVIDTSTVTISDSIDNTNATLTSEITGDEDGATVTYTMTLDKAPTTNETFTFKVDGVEKTIIVEAGKTTGTTTVTFTESDVFKDTDTIPKATDLKASDVDGASNYEQLTLVNNSKDETVVDSIDNTNATLTSEITGDEDGATVTYTMTLDKAPTTNETFTFKVDGVEKTIIVEAGKTTGTTTVTFTESDVFKDTDTIPKATDLKASDVDGASNYEQLTLVNNSKDETVVDSIDNTNATLTSEITGDEDGATVTYTMTLDKAPTTNETFTFKVDGVEKTIIVEAGKTTGTTTVTFTESDVFKDTDTIPKATDLKASDVDGASNYEQLTLVNNSKDETVVDSIDNTNATLTSEITGDEDGATVTYTMTLDKAPTTNETFTFKVDGVEKTIIVEAGKTTGTTTVTFTESDVFKDTDTIPKATDLKASDVDGASNYEQLTLVNNSKDETVVDSIDNTNATLTSEITGDEDGATVTYTMTLDKAPTTNETFTFKVDGVEKTIIVEAGKTTGTTTVTFTESDVFKDTDTIPKATDLKASDVDGASNYEQLTLVNNSKDETVVDSIDNTNATLTSEITGDEDGATVTYTMTLDKAPTTNETFTFKVDGVEKTIIVEAGKTTGTTTVTFTESDVFKDTDTIPKATDLKASDVDGASNYEQLTLVNNSKDETVVDSIDNTNATLTSEITGDEDGATVTYTMTLDKAPTTNETFTFKVDGVEKTIIVEAGKTTGTTTVTFTESDVFKDTDTIPKATDLKASDVDGASNYEQLTLVNNSKDETVVDSIDNTNATLTSEITGDEDGATVTYTMTLDKAPTTNETFTFKVDGVEKTIIVEAGKTTGTTTVTFTESDVFKDTDTIPKATDLKASDVDGASNYEQLTLVNNSKDETVVDSITPVDVTITATVTTPKIIDVTTATDGTTGVKITGFNSDGEQVDLSIITKTDHDGFGIEGKNLSNGDSKELGVGEKIVVEFTDGKDVNSLDVSFAWRNNHETAKLTFIKDGQIVGYAKVTGDGSSTTKAIVTYYDENNNLIKTVNAKGSSDKVDEAFTFELPDANGGIVSFDKVEFSAPTNVDDYLINKIVYKEVLDPSVTNIITNGGDVTFNIQIDEDYPPQGSAKAIVSVNGIDYEVVLNATGRGTLTIDSAELGDLSKVNVIVKEIIGGNYEKVNPTESSFNFTPTLKYTTDDNISTDEDVSYTLKVTDFGEVSSNTKEFKITELPTNGKLFLTITIGDTIFNPDGTQTIATQNTKVEITKDQIISLAQIGAEKVEFVPNKNSDNDGSFNFQVGDGKGNFSNDYTTTINVVAVADAPTASIDITKAGATTISTGNNDTGNSGASSSFDKLVKQTATGKDGNLEQDMQQTNSNQNIEKDYQNVNANNITTGLGNDTLKFQALNNKTVTTGEGSDKVIIDNGSNNNTINVGNGNNEISITYSLNQGSITAGSGNDTLFVGNAADGSIVNMGAGNDKVQIDGDFKSKVYLGAGDDKIALYSPHTNFEADGRSYIDGGSGFDTLYVENLNSNDFKVKIKSTGEEISWDKYSELNNHQNGEANIEFVIYHKINTNQGFVVKNIEQIIFSDKTISGETTTSAVEYKVDISAALKDTDGSETLSVVIKNVPTGAILESTKYDVSKNPDGSWSVNFKTGTTGNDLLEIKDSLTLKVPRSYKEKINLEIESKATESRDNSNGENFATAKDDASVVTVTIEPFNAELDMDISEATIKVIETKDVNTLATTSAGIYEKDGKYYKTEVQSHTEKVVNTEALKNLQVTINGKTYTGITVGADGKYYVIDNTIAKEQKTIEVEREVTKTIELDDKSIDAFMIQVTKETKGIVLGKEVTNLGAGDLISKNVPKTYALEQPTSNIEIKFTSGSAKLEFVDANGKVIGSSTTQTGTDSKGYSVPKDAVGVKITSTSTSLKIDAIKYHVDPHEETVQVGGKILDVESMQKAGITWNSTVSETKNDTSLSSAKIGSTAGDGNITGFNPEVKANSQVFDFGKDKAYQLVTIKVDVSVEGTWNFSNKATKDVFVVSANGVPQGAYNYSSGQDSTADKKVSREGYNVTDIAIDSSGKGSYKTIYEYKVYLDENGKVQMNFVVASTNKDEIVNIKNITVNYEGLSGFVQTKTEIEKVTETIFVGVPTNIEYKGEVPTKDIIKYENVEVETTPIYTKVTQYEYVLDLNATITKGNGELSEVTLEKLPDGVKVQSYEANEDGSYTIKIGEDGKAKVTLVSDTLISPEAKQEITSSITATSQDKHQISNIEVNIDEKEESNQVTTFDGEGDIDLTSIIGQYKVNYIDLENGEANDIKLNFDEILADDKEIYIKGDDKDSISLNSELWKEAESTNVDGVKYNVYTGTNSAANSTIKLLIDDDIQVNHDI